ncbi:VOC family protein [Tsukamurella ocularis]|uniref:VOC family protein n=1 Tax=Tsukamurella ocularis TaxID=1970234 RepID=UPI002167BEAB|nr:VOC family protein [Tsukamurella ocularis]MCS3779806.1 catechol 2,3-dioxygenase-like lactoylglutathione lyase family enzyme [Tsukamurella ocularis]MCS3788794.1 catechol 2,3-dioxygenase-like lactoylglutathione lyase family enzyme [Tsukamurella ocularis]MCS3850004.1 catechol 2,3-dioxygenase-like lactoylglutathione lyase family enzyme [Tsukamurella ocularis]
MFTSIAITSVFVLDQDEALDFYVGKLGFEVHDDVDMGFMRWLTIALPSDPQRELVLEVLGVGGGSPETVAAQRDLLTKGALGVACILNTDDCRGVFEKLSAQGVEFTEEPQEQPYGIDCALRDPFGNHIRITQRKQAPVEVTQADVDRWSGA